MKIFIGLTEVSGYYANLCKGFEELGIEVLHVPLQGHRFQYADTAHLPLPARLASYCVKRRVAVPAHRRLTRLTWLGLVTPTRALLFFWAFARFDCFILGGGSSFFRLAELPLLKLLRKRVVYTFHGTDARPAYIDGFFHELSQNSQSRDIASAPDRASIADAYIRASRQRRRALKKIERWADAIVCGPSFGQFMTKPFYNFLAIGVPAGLSSQGMAQNPNRSDCVRVLHAPSQQDGKGTDKIREAVESLKRKGLRIEYVEVSGRPNAEVLAEIARADFVIDQLYSDTPMAGFATESAFLGRPALVGGYYCDQLAEDLPAELIPPSLFCRPEQIGAWAERLARDSLLRQDLRRRAQAFVRERWRPRDVAGRYLEMIRGQAPAVWQFEPARLRYVHGNGLPEFRVRQNVRAVVERGGVEALQLQANPELESLFLEFAVGDTATC